MPILEQAWKAVRGRRVVVLGINVQDTPEHAAAFLKALGITYPNVYDPGKARVDAYQVIALPTTIFIDREMHIRGRLVGGYRDPEGYWTLRGHIAALLDTAP
jgi:peroxiredoxin